MLDCRQDAILENLLEVKRKKKYKPLNNKLQKEKKYVAEKPNFQQTYISYLKKIIVKKYKVS